MHPFCYQWLREDSDSRDKEPCAKRHATHVGIKRLDRKGEKTSVKMISDFLTDYKIPKPQDVESGALHTKNYFVYPCPSFKDRLEFICRSRNCELDHKEISIKHWIIKQGHDSRSRPAQSFTELQSILESTNTPFEEHVSQFEYWSTPNDILIDILDLPSCLDLIDRSEINVWLGDGRTHISTALPLLSGFGIASELSEIQVYKSEREAKTHFVTRLPVNPKPRHRRFGDFSEFKVRTFEDLTSNRNGHGSSAYPYWPQLFPWKHRFHYKGVKKYPAYFTTPHWRSVSGKFKPSEKNERRCYCCNHVFDCGYLIDVHHIKPVDRFGSNSLQNLVRICIACHAAVHNKKEILDRGLIRLFVNTKMAGEPDLERLLHDRYPAFVQAYDDTCSDLDIYAVKQFFHLELQRMIRFAWPPAAYEQLLEDYAKLCEQNFAPPENRPQDWDLTEELILDWSIVLACTSRKLSAFANDMPFRVERNTGDDLALSNSINLLTKLESFLIKIFQPVLKSKIDSNQMVDALKKLLVRIQDTETDWHTSPWHDKEVFIFNDTSPEKEQRVRARRQRLYGIAANSIIPNALKIEDALRENDYWVGILLPTVLKLSLNEGNGIELLKSLKLLNSKSKDGQKYQGRPPLNRYESGFRDHKSTGKPVA